LPNILEKIPEFEEFEEHDSEETGRILILWSYTPEKITNVNIRNYLIERANTKVGIIDEEIAKQESLKKAETDSITRLS
jgi:hypothetical protein